MSYVEFRSKLAAESEEEYREFSMKGIPSDRPFVGVRIPKIRKIVTELPSEDKEMILGTVPIAIEEVLARGMVIAGMRYSKMLEYFDSQIDYIDNWCTCDIFCSALRNATKKHKEDFLTRKVEKLLLDKREFAVRVGIVLLKTGYVEFDYLFMIFDRVERLAGREEYYIKMALAWLVAECFIKYPDETLGFLQTTKLPKWTYNKAISKICDSLRVTPEQKDILRALRK